MARPKQRPSSALPAEIMTLEEVAAWLHCHRITLYRLLRKDEIPAFKVASDWRFRRETIEQWMTRREAEQQGSRRRQSR
jgi:excisionase family DNA binding protein